MKTATQSPAQILAGRIATRLVKEELLAEDRAAKFSATLAAGKLKSGDWRLAIEAVKQTKPKSPTNNK